MIISCRYPILLSPLHSLGLRYLPRPARLTAPLPERRRRHARWLCEGGSRLCHRRCNFRRMHKSSPRARGGSVGYARGHGLALVDAGCRWTDSATGCRADGRRCDGNEVADVPSWHRSGIAVVRCMSKYAAAAIWLRDERCLRYARRDAIHRWSDYCWKM
jgi:hypothetical protein